MIDDTIILRQVGRHEGKWVTTRYRVAPGRRTKMGKRVRITLEVDASFVHLLRANLTMKTGALDGSRQLDVLQVLGVVAIGEMMGATAEQIHLRTPPEWRPHIEAIHAERRWQEEGEPEWHATGT